MTASTSPLRTPELLAAACANRGSTPPTGQPAATRAVRIFKPMRPIHNRHSNNSAAPRRNHDSRPQNSVYCLLPGANLISHHTSSFVRPTIAFLSPLETLRPFQASKVHDPWHQPAYVSPSPLKCHPESQILAEMHLSRTRPCRVSPSHTHTIFPLAHMPCMMIQEEPITARDSLSSRLQKPSTSLWFRGWLRSRRRTAKNLLDLI